ncbi:MAG: DUF4097 domain-containing protein [Treponema sp.]|nr:DUF4097 domain-containing protein [Treponema sp.]
MKAIVLSALFVFFFAFSAFSNGNLELVNNQEIKLDNITDIKILYSSEKVSIYMGTTDKLIIKEFMNENNKQYYAKIDTRGNSLTIENGKTPFRPLFNIFMRRLEVYIPVSYMNAINIKTSSGSIDTSDLFCQKIGVESSSGKILVSSITGQKINIKSSSGQIEIGALNGDISIESLSGSIELGKVTGSLNAKTTSGSIHCAVAENAGNISLLTTSGAVRLNLPQSLNFNFTSRTSSGKLTTPFSDKLSSPLTDKNLSQGIVSNNNGSRNISVIDIKTSSGHIRIEWT